jgi:CheY-like chemotaxis protein
MMPTNRSSDAPNPTAPVDPVAPAKLILLVDDQPFFLTVTSHLLRMAGFRIETVTNGAAALVAARTYRPAAILLDVEMPGLDGIETCRRLRANPATAQIPVAMLTASQNPNLTHDAYTAGAQVTIPKSVDRDRLVHWVHTLTAARPSRPESSGAPAPDPTQPPSHP